MQEKHEAALLATAGFLKGTAQIVKQEVQGAPQATVLIVASVVGAILLPKVIKDFGQ